MHFDPKIFLQVAALSTFGVSGLLYCFGYYSLASGVMMSSLLLMVNLWGWIWSIKTLISITKEGGSSSLFGLFTAMKFTVMATTLFAVFFLFGAPAIFIANSILVTSLLSPSLYYALQSSKGLSNEC
jgi:hypothetical protein